MGLNTKLCRACGQDKALEAFNKDNKRPDGRRTRCRECDAKYFQARYANPEWKESHNQRAKRWRDKLKNADPKKLWAFDALANAKMRAKRAGVPCTLTLLDVMGIVVDTCPLLGLPIVYAQPKLSDNSPTLDKKIPRKGYVQHNIAVISHRANRLKSDSTIEELQTLLNNLVQYMNSD